MNLPKEESARDGHGPKGWNERGYLPHFDGREITQAVTFRLADSVPVRLLRLWKEELHLLERIEANREERRRVEGLLDTGIGECLLKQPEVAQIVQGAFLHFDGTRYAMHAWVVMPNHVHALFTPSPDCSLGTIVGSWKSFTAKEINRTLGRTGKRWADDYWDRYIRDGEHFVSALNYIEANPVKAGLCRESHEWPWSSAASRPLDAPGTGAVPD